MENKGLVSVIIPVYNVEKYLNECVESVLKQSYKNYEIILVDDGSTDLSGKICDEYAEKYECVKVLHKENSGPSATRNAGISEAQGEYIFFLDSDDYVIDSALEKLVKASENENSDIVFFDAVSFVDEKPEEKIHQGYKRNGTYIADSGLETLERLNKGSDFKCAIYLMLIRKSIIEENKLSFCEDAFCSEDLLFTFQLFCLAKRVSQLDEALYYRRYRDNSIVTSAKKERHFLSCRIVYKEMEAFCKNEGIYEKDISKAFIQRSAFNALDTYKKIRNEEQKKNINLYKELKKDILNENAYGSMALKMRCYGKVFWFGYKVLEKTVGRFFI